MVNRLNIYDGSILEAIALAFAQEGAKRFSDFNVHYLRKISKCNSRILYLQTKGFNNSIEGWKSHKKFLQQELIRIN